MYPKTVQVNVFAGSVEAGAEGAHAEQDLQDSVQLPFVEVSENEWDGVVTERFAYYCGEHNGKTYEVWIPVTQPQPAAV